MMKGKTDKTDKTAAAAVGGAAGGAETPVKAAPPVEFYGRFVVLAASDTMPGPQPQPLTGLKYPGDFRWVQELGMHCLDGKVFDLTKLSDVADFQKASDNFHRSPRHRFVFPVVRFVGVPAAAVLREPLPKPLEAPPDKTPGQEPKSVTPDGQVISPAAKKLAGEHGVALEGLKGTGMGGIITKTDVRAAMMAKEGARVQGAGGPAAPGLPTQNLSMAELKKEGANAA